MRSVRSAVLVYKVTPENSLQLSGSFGEAELSCGGEWLSQMEDGKIGFAIIMAS